MPTRNGSVGVFPVLFSVTLEPSIKKGSGSENMA
jgi:hypothetical protein